MTEHYFTHQHSPLQTARYHIALSANSMTTASFASVNLLWTSFFLSFQLVQFGSQADNAPHKVLPRPVPLGKDCLLSAYKFLFVFDLAALEVEMLLK